MGIILMKDIVHEMTRYPDESAEIGSSKKFRNITATRIEKINGVYVVGKEVPAGDALKFGPIQRRILYKEREEWRWRLECKISAECTEIVTEDCIVISEFPRSNQYVCFARVKSSLHDQSRRIDLSQESFASAVKIIENQNYDYWESGCYHTAGILIPNDFLIKNNDDIRNKYANTDWLFGVCKEPEQIVGELFQSPEANKLLAQSVCFGKDGQIHPLKNTTKEQQLSLLQTSIRQALAGPHRESFSDKNGQQIKWQGQSIMKLAEFIFYDHLNNINRRKNDLGKAIPLILPHAESDRNLMGIIVNKRSPDPEQDTLCNEIKEIISSLESPDKEIIEWKFGLNGGELPIEEIAERTSLSITTVYARVKSILKTLRQKISY